MMGQVVLVETQLRSVEVTAAHMAPHHLGLKRRLRVRVEQTVVNPEWYGCGLRSVVYYEHCANSEALLGIRLQTNSIN
jgi:hypothetical protein